MIKIDLDDALNFLINHKEALRKYCRIISLVQTTDISSNLDFQHTFNGFYRVRRGKEWQEYFYSFFEKNKNVETFTITNIMTQLYNDTGRIEASFSSKMLASINPDQPIWDSIILKNFGKKAPAGNTVDRISASGTLYKEIIDIYKEYLLTDESNHNIKQFDLALLEFSKITNIKKIDFLTLGTHPKS